jgi:NCS2 family nucleobase:cation symporter-2
VTRRPDTLIYAVGESPPLATTIFLGLQQVALMAIYLVMVVIVVRAAGASADVAQSAVSLGLIAMGISAGLQALPKGLIGSGYLAPPVISAIYLSPSLLAVKTGGLPLVFGMTMVAGFFEAVLSRLLRRLRLVFPPLICGFIVAAVGLELGLIGVAQLLDVKSPEANARFDLHVSVAALTLATMIGLAIWGRGTFRLLCSLVGVLLGFVVAAFTGLTSPADIGRILDTPYLALPRLTHIGYAFDLTVLVPFVLAGLAAGLRTVGVVTTCQRINDADWKRPDLRTIQGGVLADGIGCVIGGGLGVVGMGSAPSLVGVSQASGATSRVIAFAVTGLCAALACSPKLAAVFLALPECVVGAGLVFTASFMVAGGIQIIASRELDARKTFVIGVALLLGLSRPMFPGYYATLPHAVQALTGSLLSVAMLAAIALNLVFYVGLRRSTNLVLEVAGRPEAADAALAEVMQRTAKSWKIAPDVVARAREVTERAVHLIQDGRLADGPITVRITFDELTLEIVLEYRGDLLSLPAHRSVSEDNLIEEQPFVKGLAGFLVGVYPDRVRTSTDDGRCRVSLVFEV